MCLSNKDEEKLKVFERTIIRRTVGQKKNRRGVQRNKGNKCYIRRRNIAKII